MIYILKRIFKKRYYYVLGEKQNAKTFNSYESYLEYYKKKEIGDNL